MPSTDTPQPRAVDYHGHPLTEGDRVAFISTDPVQLAHGRIRIIGLHDVCIETDEHLVTFRGVSARWDPRPPRPLGGTTAPREDTGEALRYPHIALQPAAPGPALVREQKDRPTHPDGTPYSYAEITAEGWGYCDGCRMWSTGTTEQPHQCAETRMRAVKRTTKSTAQDGA